MALEIKKTPANGTVVNYHRISKTLIDFNSGETKILIASYVNNTIRDSEKSQVKKVNDLSKLRTELDILVREPTDENEAKRKRLSDKVNAIADGNEPHAEDLSIVTQEFSMNVSDGYTQKSIYAHLKSLPDFDGAKDI